MKKIRLPFLVLTYGDFKETRKLFIYEKHGKLILPIFNDMKKANKYLTSMEELMRSNGDNRDLMIQVCDNLSYAQDILKILNMSFNVSYIALDCTSRRDNKVCIMKAIDQLSV